MYFSIIGGVTVLEEPHQVILGVTGPHKLISKHTPKVVDFGAGLGAPDIEQRK